MITIKILHSKPARLRLSGFQSLNALKFAQAHKPVEEYFMTVPGGPQDVSFLLKQWSEGNPESLNELVPLLENELRQIARRYMRAERRGHTLQTTALIHEAYLRVVGQDSVDWQNRSHFLAIAAKVMRQILVDHARRSHRTKRGGGQDSLPLDEAVAFSPERSEHLVNLDEALTKLAGADARKAQVVELRYFVGLNVEETAQVLQVSPNTVIRDWSLSKAWLKREMESGPGGHEG